MRHVYWIGGGSGAGKSTIARRLADRHGWRLCSTDEVMADHARRTTADEAPFLHAFMSMDMDMDMDERWIDRSPETMLETFHWFRGEAFDLIVEDLARVPAGTPVVVELPSAAPPGGAAAPRARTRRLVASHPGVPPVRVHEPCHTGRRVHATDP
ncbi:hypothetical protein ACIQXA_36315 [Streptomyces massasporeus]|uniref:hypothetical protein n=1 Tax=Streptomyces massasporeus TaxID=67324 RepID=UPI0038153B70